MELALSLGHTNNPSMGFSMALPHETRASSDPPLQLHHLLPSTPVLPSPRLPIPWLSHALGMEEIPVRVLDDTDDGAAVSSPNNSAVSSYFCRNSRKFCEGDSEEDENGSTRKKLRLSKTQSAFLEDSFKEHTTLNPKQKLVLAKELNLRPRQVEVWFQNRRARTKLKQTEVDCEYLKRCCENLSEENKRLQKELQELRALKTCEPFFMQLPATTLTMCPSCERVATTTSTSAAAASATNNRSVSLNKPRILSGPHAAGPPGPSECFF